MPPESSGELLRSFIENIAWQPFRNSQPAFTGIRTRGSVGHAGMDDPWANKINQDKEDEDDEEFMDVDCEIDRTGKILHESVWSATQSQRRRKAEIKPEDGSFALKVWC